MGRPAIVLAVLGVLAMPRSAFAQDRAGPLIEAARAQIDALNSDSAVALLQSAFAQSPNPTQRLRAFVLVGIAELSRNNRQAARNAFELALRIDGALKIDSLSDLASDAAVVFGEARTSLGIGNAVAPAGRAALTVESSLPADTTVPVSGGLLRIETRPSYHARVIAMVTPADAPSVIVWSDTQDVGGIGTRTWNLHGRDGAPVAPGRYALRVRAIDSTGQVSPDRERVLVIARVPADTTPMPAVLGPSAFAPETLRVHRGSALGLASGLAIAAGAAFVPSALGNASLKTGASYSAAYAVAGAVSVASIVGFLRGVQVQPQPQNTLANQTLRQRDAAERQRIARANELARNGAPVRVRLEGGP